MQCGTRLLLGGADFCQLCLCIHAHEANAVDVELGGGSLLLHLLEGQHQRVGHHGDALHKFRLLLCGEEVDAGFFGLEQDVAAQGLVGEVVGYLLAVFDATSRCEFGGEINVLKDVEFAFGKLAFHVEGAVLDAGFAECVFGLLFLHLRLLLFVEGAQLDVACLDAAQDFRDGLGAEEGGHRQQAYKKNTPLPYSTEGIGRTV